MPAIGDLFKSRPQDIQETINSIFYMLKQRIADLDNKTEFRQKISRAEAQSSDAKQQLEKAKTKLETLQKEVGDLKYKIKTNEEKHKQEVQKMTQEKEELLKAITKVQHKETQYSHEIKSRDN